MASHGEFAMLISSVTSALNEAMTDGDIAGYNNEWQTLTIGDHLDHAYKHVHEMGCLVTPELIEQELNHAIFRLAAIKTALIQSRMIKEEGH